MLAYGIIALQHDEMYGLKIMEMQPLPNYLIEISIHVRDILSNLMMYCLIPCVVKIEKSQINSTIQAFV